LSTEDFLWSSLRIVFRFRQSYLKIICTVPALKNPIEFFIIYKIIKNIFTVSSKWENMKKPGGNNPSGLS